jgi:hypothetical protein
VRCDLLNYRTRFVSFIIATISCLSVSIYLPGETMNEETSGNGGTRGHFQYAIPMPCYFRHLRQPFVDGTPLGWTGNCATSNHLLTPYDRIDRFAFWTRESARHGESEK